MERKLQDTLDWTCGWTENELGQPGEAEDHHYLHQKPLDTWITHTKEAGVDMVRKKKKKGN